MQSCGFYDENKVRKAGVFHNLNRKSANDCPQSSKGNCLFSDS